MSVNRHDAGTVVAGKAAGGQFAASSRTEAGAAALATGATRMFSITPAPRKVQLAVGKPPELPLGWSEPEVTFGVDDSGRFYSAWSFKEAGGQEDATVYCTDYEEGPSLTADEDVFDDGRDNSAEAPILAAHNALRTNAYRAGYAACEEDPELNRQVLAASLGKPIREPSEDDVPAPERAAARAEQRLVGWGDGGAPAEDIRDAMTDLAHYADKHGLDIHELFKGAIEMQLEEKEYPHG